MQIFTFFLYLTGQTINLGLDKINNSKVLLQQFVEFKRFGQTIQTLFQKKLQFSSKDFLPRKKQT